MKRSLIIFLVVLWLTAFSTSQLGLKTTATGSIIEPVATPTIPQPGDPGRWTSYTTADGLVSNYVTALAIDAAGHKWFGTTNGVSEFDGQNWTSYMVEDGLTDNRVTAIAIDAAGHKWFGTSNGVSEFDGQSWTTYTPKDRLAGAHIFDIAIDQDGHKWFATLTGLSQFDGQTWTTHLPNWSINSIAIDSQRRIWAGVVGGDILVLDGQTLQPGSPAQAWTTYTRDERQRASQPASAKGQLNWFDSWDDSPFNQWFLFANLSLIPLGGAPEISVPAIAIDQIGHKWFAHRSTLDWADQGVTEFDGDGTPGTGHWYLYTVEAGDGLADNRVQDIAVNAAGHKWFATQKGVSVFDGQNWASYTVEDGLADNYVTAIAIDPAGPTWFATGKGVSVFEGQPFSKNETPPVAAATVTPDRALTPTISSGETTPNPAVALATVPPWSSVSPTLPALPHLADLSPSLFKASGTDLALFYTQNDILFRYDVRQRIAQPVARMIPPHPYLPATPLLSPNGHYLAYNDDVGLQLFDTRQGTVSLLLAHVLPTDAEPTKIEMFSPSAWGPANTLLVGSGFFEGGGTSWLNLDERVLHRVAGWASDVAWSPDGRQVAIVGRAYSEPFGFTFFDRENNTYRDILKPGLAFAKNRYQIVAEPYHLDWSADGQWLAMSWSDSIFSPVGYARLYLLRPDGRDLMALTNNSHGTADFPLWDSTGALYYSLNQIDPQTDGIYRADPASGPSTQLIAGGDLQPLSFSPGGAFLLFYQRPAEQAQALALWSERDNQIEVVTAWPATESPAKFVGWLAGEQLWQTWQVRTLLVGPGQAGRLYALLSSSDSTVRLVISDDFGQTWAPFPGGLPVEPTCVRNVNLDYATPDALYASTCQGLYRWLGSEWKLISPQQTGMVAIAYGQPESLWATAPYGPTADPVLRSDNGGQSWNPASQNLLHFNGVANLGIDPRDSKTLYAIIWPQAAGSYLRRGTANGEWTTLPTPLDNITINSGMTLDGASGTLYVTTCCTADNSQLWRSLNPTAPDLQAIQWDLIHDFGAGVQAELLASGWSLTGLALYANLTLAGQGDQPVLHRSLDGGQTWTPLPISLAK